MYVYIHIYIYIHTHVSIVYGIYFGLDAPRELRERQLQPLLAQLQLSDLLLQGKITVARQKSTPQKSSWIIVAFFNGCSKVFSTTNNLSVVLSKGLSLFQWIVTGIVGIVQWMFSDLQ